MLRMLSARLIRSHHPERPAVMLVISDVTRFTYFRAHHGLHDLGSAIAWIEEVVPSTSSSHFARPRMLAILSAFYFTCFEISGDLADLNSMAFLDGVTIVYRSDAFGVQNGGQCRESRWLV